MTTPIRPTDDAACQLARQLLATARHAALGVLHDDATPMVTRIAFGLGANGAALSLVSDLSAHTRALRSNPACSLLVGDPGPRGDPLTHPRLTLLATARFIERDDPQHGEMATQYLRDHPKSKLYIGFADFSFIVFRPRQGLLNGGFGQAFHLTPADMNLPG